MLGLAGVAALVVGLLVSIALHELGHLVPAKRFGRAVPEYSIGFGPSLFSFTRGGTTYRLRAVPLGGYVRILGMFPPAPEGRRSLPVVERAREASAAELDAGDERAFWRLSPGRRIVVMSGGVAMNFALWALLSAVVLVGVGVPGATTTVGQVSDCVPGASSSPEVMVECVPGSGSPASRAGLQPGDVVVAVAGAPVSGWDDAMERVRRLPVGVPAELTVDRAGRQMRLEVVPVASPFVDGAAYIGVAPQPGLVRMSPVDAPRALAGQVGATVGGVAAFPTRLASTAVDTAAGRERDPNGPIGVVGVSRIGGEVAAMQEVPLSFRVVQLVLLLAGVNLALGVFNLVPLLPLDGGHVVAAAWEGLRRRVARLRGRPDPGPVDLARMLPVGYAVGALVFVAGGLLVVLDIVNPVRLFG